MPLDFNLTAGDILTAATILGGGFVFLFRMEGKLNLLVSERKLEIQSTTTKFSVIEKQLEKLTECLIQLAKQEQRIDALQSKIEDVVDMVRPKHELSLVTPKRKYAAKA